MWFCSRESAMRARVPVIAAVAFGIAVAVARRGRHGARAPEIRTGTFSSGIAYEAIGSGPRTVVFLPGGPGIIPMAWARVARTVLWPLAAKGCTVWRLTRRSGMPPGHSLAGRRVSFGARMSALRAR